MPGQRRGDDRDHQVGVAAIRAQLLDLDDPEPGDGEDRQRHLEDEPAGEHRRREEAVVVAGPELDVELGRR